MFYAVNFKMVYIHHCNVWYTLHITYAQALALSILIILRVINALPFPLQFSNYGE